MHPSEVRILKQNLDREGRMALRQTTIYEADGFEGLKSQLPPLPRRAITIIDPSYEDKHDYRKTLLAVNEGLRRFASGCFCVWYPLVQRREAHELARALERLKTPWIHASLTVRKPASDGIGLHGSGMFVLNPPWTLHAELNRALPWLKDKLGLDDRASYTLKQFGS
jgi:23S rRNA (adenine2030-N6)-methyltransferase